MPLWGKSASAATNKPKWLPDDENSPYHKDTVYASDKGWVQAPGTAASGSDNVNAQPEVLACIGELATTLSSATVTDMRFVVGSTATTDLTSGDGTQRILVEIHGMKLLL